MRHAPQGCTRSDTHFVAELERLIEAHNIKADEPNSSSTSPKARPRSPSSISTSKAGSQEPGSAAAVNGRNVSAVVPDPNDNADPLLEVFYPGWPSSLPHPNVVAYVVNVFLTRCRRTEGSIQVDPAAFRVALNRPPTSVGFPHLGLIHAMMALAYREWGGDELAMQLNGGHKYWIKEPGEGKAGSGKGGGRIKDCADYHAAWATRAVEDSLAKGFHLFQMSQAINVLCSFFYVSARFVEGALSQLFDGLYPRSRFGTVWIYCGLATRISTPLGLNHLESCAEYTSGAKIRPRSLMPPPTTVEEKYRRSITFWLAFLNDRYASAAASWAHSLDERDISSLLPSMPGTTGATLDEVDLRTHPLSISNPDFFSVHPPDVDELQMELKCTILLGRASALQALFEGRRR